MRFTRVVDAQPPENQTDEAGQILKSEPVAASITQLVRVQVDNCHSAANAISLRVPRRSLVRVSSRGSTGFCIPVSEPTS